MNLNAEPDRPTMLYAPEFASAIRIEVTSSIVNRSRSEKVIGFKLLAKLLDEGDNTAFALAHNDHIRSAWGSAEKSRHADVRKAARLALVSFKRLEDVRMGVQPPAGCRLC